MNETLNVKAVTHLTGLNEHTLRAWERRYGAVKPSRSETGRRSYTDDDVERLRLMRKLTERGFAIGGLARRSYLELQETLVNAMALDESAAVATPPIPASPLATFGQNVEAALLNYDLALIYRLLQEARVKSSAKQFVLDLIQPLIASVGHMITIGRFSIAQEHALSAIVKSHLTDILSSLRHGTAIKGRDSIAFATMEGDLHEIGILICAVLCAVEGHLVQYIGPNMPPEPLVDALLAMETTMIVLGVTPSVRGAKSWKLDDYLAALSKGLPKKHEIWIGGQAAATSHPDLRQRCRYFRSFRDFDAALEQRVVT